MSEASKPSHRGGRRRAAVSTPRKALRSAGLLAAAAVAVTGVAVAGGVLGQSAGAGAAESVGAVVAMAPESAVASERSGRDEVLSRSDRRREVDPSKLAGLQPGKPAATSAEKELSQSDPKDIARALMPEYGFSSSEFGCLESLWQRESGWNPLAHNPSSGAHGIPQSLPGSKMATEGADWYTNPATQIAWGLGYIKGRYGTPCSAWGHSESHGWY